MVWDRRLGFTFSCIFCVLISDQVLEELLAFTFPFGGFYLCLFSLYKHSRVLMSCGQKHVLPLSLFRVLIINVFYYVSYYIRVRVKTYSILDHTTSIHHHDNFYLSYGNRVIDLYYLNVG
jgi:hypothetical protein